MSERKFVLTKGEIDHTVRLPEKNPLNLFDRIGMYVLCAAIGHPPMTSLGEDDKTEHKAERVANLMAMRGARITVSCGCGRKMVDPIWRPWWRRD